jgi:hypothetical protein
MKTSKFTDEQKAICLAPGRGRPPGREHFRQLDAVSRASIAARSASGPRRERGPGAAPAPGVESQAQSFVADLSLNNDVPPRGPNKTMVAAVHARECVTPVRGAVSSGGDMTARVLTAAEPACRLPLRITVACSGHLVNPRRQRPRVRPHATPGRSKSGGLPLRDPNERHQE